MKREDRDRLASLQSELGRLRKRLENPRVRSGDKERYEQRIAEIAPQVADIKARYPSSGE